MKESIFIFVDIKEPATIVEVYKSSTETHPPPPPQSLNSQIQSRVDPKTRIMEVLDIASGILKPKKCEYIKYSVA